MSCKSSMSESELSLLHQAHQAPQTQSNHIEHLAEVVSVETDHLWVRVERQSACGQCAQKTTCASSQEEGGWWKRRAFLVPAYLSESMSADVYQPGDWIRVGVDPKVLLTASLRAYLWPLVGLMGMLLLANQAFDWLFMPAGKIESSVASWRDLWVLLIGGLGLWGLLVGFGRQSKLLKLKRQYQVEVLGKSEF